MLTLYTLTSGLHSEAAGKPSEERFIREIEERLGEEFDFRSEDFTRYGETLDNVIYVRTGGTEGVFKSVFCNDGHLQVPDNKPIRLLTSGKSNSLAASMEILSFLNRNGYPAKSYMVVRRLSQTDCAKVSQPETNAMSRLMTWDGYWTG